MTSEELYSKFEAALPGKLEKAKVEVKGYLTLKVLKPSDLLEIAGWLKRNGFDYLDIVTAVDYKGPVDVKGFIMDPNPNAFLPEGATPQIEAPTATPNFPYREAFELVYCFSSLKERLKVFLKVEIARDVAKDNAELPSLVPVFQAADWQERETFDLFGIHFKNHPNETKILTPDFIKGNPLRKDYVHVPDMFD